MITSSAILTLLVLLIVVGVLLWAVNTLIPMDQRIRSLINVVVIVGAVLLVVSWLLGGVRLT